MGEKLQKILKLIGIDIIDHFKEILDIYIKDQHYYIYECFVASKFCII
jgi:hypothetical protein